MNPVQASQTLRLSQSPVHIQQNNSLFMDLHVEPYSAQKLIYYSTTGISTDKYPFQVPGW